MRKIVVSILLGGLATLLFYSLKLIYFANQTDKDTDKKQALNVFMESIQDGRQCNTLLLFVTGDCPLCKNYRPLIRQLSDSLGADLNWALRIIRMDLPDTIDSKQVPAYIYPFSDFDRYDEKGLFSSMVGATVTPQVFVFNKKHQMVYSGAIDNWAVETGRHRAAATQFYLKGVIDSLNAGFDIQPWFTKPVGCYIEKTESQDAN